MITSITNMKKKSRILRSVVLLTLLFIYISVPIMTYADNLSEVQKNDVRLQVSDRLRQLTSNRVNYTDDRGAVYSLMNLMDIGMWYEFASNDSDVDFKDDELTAYKDYLEEAVKQFDGTYSSETEGLSHTVSLKMDDSSGLSHTEYSKKLVDTVSTTIASYYESLWKEIKDELDKKDGDDAKNEYLKDPDVSTIVKAVYRSCQRIGEEHSDILSLCKLADSKSLYTYNRNINTTIAVINKDDYKLLIQRAQELIDNDIALSESGQDMDGDTAWDRYLSEIDGKYLVNEHWLKVFACSASYIPFKSKIGEASFITSLTSIDDDPTATDTYNSICNRKKPLYYVKSNERDDSGNLKNTATRITVQDFVKSITNNESGVLVSPNGGFQKSSDKDSYVVSHGDGTNRYADNGDVTNQKSSDSTGTPTNEGNDPNETYLGDSISDTSILSDAILTYGGDIGTKNAIMNSILLYNFFQDDKTVEAQEDLSKRFLYVNPFGDIVLDDNTIIVPGSANATYYSDAGGTVYNPCTAAFMNYYPKASLTSAYFGVSMRDSGKYIVAMSASTTDTVEDQNDDGSKETGFWATVKNGAKSAWNDISNRAGRVKNAISNVTTRGNEGTAEDKFNQNTVGPLEDSEVESTAYIIAKDRESLDSFKTGDYCMPMEFKMYNQGGDKYSILRAFNYKYKTSINGVVSTGKSIWNNNYLVIPDNSTLSDFGKSDCLFPLSGKMSDEVYVNKAKFLACKMYDSMSVGAGGDYAGLNSRYDRSYLTEVFKEGYNGSSNIAAFVKNSMEEYDSKLASSSWDNTIKDITKKISETLGTSTGAVGLKNSYEDPIFGRFLYYAKEFIYIFFLLIGFIFLVKFNRKHANWFYCVCGIALSVALTYLLLEIVPLYLPTFLNGVINNVSDNIGYRTLEMKLEQYKNIDEDISKSGIGYGTSSFNVYRLSDEQINQISDEMKVDTDKLVAGDKYIVDNGSGLFIEGDCVKLNVDKFFNSLSITSTRTGSGTSSVYQLESHRYAGNCADYYFVYYPIVDSFIGKLNKFEQLYKGMTKDSFLVSDYIQSDLFLNGDDLSKLEDQFGTELYQKAIDTSMFGDNNIDFLGLSDVFIKMPSQNLDDIKDCLWFKTMQRQGYYDDVGTVIDDDKMGKLIERVNRSVKQYLINHNDEIAFISDENLIKSVCLYASTEINREISYFDDCVYPQSLNYEEIKLNDVYLATLTKDYDRYVAANKDIVDYINSELGSAGMIVFSVLMCEGWLISEIMNVGMPVLYIALLGCCIVRIIGKQNSEIKMVFKGYLKVFGAISVCYFLFCVLTAKVGAMKSLVLAMIVLIFFYSMFLAIMLSVITALLMSGFDFGSARVNASLTNIAKKARLYNGYNQIKEAIQRIRPGRNITDGSDYNPKSSKFKKYSYSTSVDDLYGDEIDASVIERRHPGFTERYSDSSDESSYRSKRTKKKKEPRRVYQEIEDDDDDDKFKY